MEDNKTMKKQIKQTILISIATSMVTAMTVVSLTPSHMSYVQNTYVNVDYKEVNAVISKYNPVKEQTDSTPDINAMGKKVKNGDIANNCLDFGTKVEIDGYTYTVVDRMNKRYDCTHFDVLSFNYKEAISYGRKTKTIKIYE